MNVERGTSLSKELGNEIRRPVGGGPEKVDLGPGDVYRNGERNTAAHEEIVMEAEPAGLNQIDTYLAPILLPVFIGETPCG